MTNTAKRMAEADRRRAILSGLLIMPGHTLPERGIRNQVEVAGYIVDLEVLRADLAALDDLGLAERTEAGHWHLTDRGADVVLGRKNLPGVRAAEPGETG